MAYILKLENEHSLLHFKNILSAYLNDYNKLVFFIDFLLFILFNFVYHNTQNLFEVTLD